MEKATMKKEQRFPPGWNEERVRQVIVHYENQTGDEEFAEIEASHEEEGITMMELSPPSCA